MAKKIVLLLAIVLVMLMVYGSNRENHIIQAAHDIYDVTDPTLPQLYQFENPHKQHRPLKTKGDSAAPSNPESSRG